MTAYFCEPFNLFDPSLGSYYADSWECVPYLALRVGISKAELILCRKGKQLGRPLTRSKVGDAGYCRGRRETFWLSLDADSRVLKYGKGSRMYQKTSLQYDLPTSEGKFPVLAIFLITSNPKQKCKMQSFFLIAL